MIRPLVLLSAFNESGGCDADGIWRGDDDDNEDEK